MSLAQGYFTPKFSDAKGLGKIPMGQPQRGRQIEVG